MKEPNIIIQAIAGFIRSIRTTSRAKYIDELEKKHNFIIDFNTLKTYEEHKRCCTIGTLLRISKFSETNLNELKEEIGTNKEYKNIENLWEKCPADIFLSFAIENDIDLEKLKKKIKYSSSVILQCKINLSKARR